MNKKAKILYILAAILIAYGYIARLAEIYLFWESRYIGFIFLFLGFIFHRGCRVAVKKQQSKKATFEKIGIGLIIFILVVQAAVYFIFPSTDAFRAATDYVKQDQEIRGKVGEVISISLVPKGSMQVKTTNNISEGSATFYLIVKGSRKFTDVVVDLGKNRESEWTVISLATRN